MNIEEIRDSLPDYARDLKLNLGSVLTASGAPGLNEKQIWSIALASAIAARNTAFARDVEAQAQAHLADVEVEGAKAAAAIASHQEWRETRPAQFAVKVGAEVA